MDGAIAVQPATSKPAPAAILPELRQELNVQRGGPAADGAPSWLIVDPVQHRYIQIDEAAYQMLSQWQSGVTVSAFKDTMLRAFSHAVSDDEVTRFVAFLADNNLTVEPLSGGWQSFSERAKRAEHGWMMWMIHNYLYIKLPLVHPEAFLKRMAPAVAPLYTRTCAVIVACIGLAGLYLVSRQWDAFATTFQYSFSWQGAATYAVALALVKSAHELGHAFTAVRYGCRVPSMGVCFLVMFPVLYTDVTDAWRLQSRRERLAIGSAGVMVELALACLATFLWAFLPDGILKGLAFSIATVGWLLSLAVNLNPLMRFDGYYLFSDALGVENLQSRAFAFGQWRMREILFDLQLAPPERLPPATARTLTIYAWVIWIYRLVVFTGIAVLVYHMAFKALGIILFLVEIVYFIVRPVASELLRWRQDGRAIRATRRSKLTAAAALVLVLVALVPWSTQISIPAVLEASEIARVYPQRAGLVVAVKVAAGDTVTKGDVLVVLRSSETEHQLALTKSKIALVQMRLARRSADQEDRARSLVMEQELKAAQSELAGLTRERQELTIVAPASGVVAEFNTAVHPGRTIGRAEVVALIRGGDVLVARGYMAEHDVGRIGKSGSGRFIADVAGFDPVPVRLLDIVKASATSIDMPELASTHGGPIPVRQQAGAGGQRRLTPAHAVYLTVLKSEPSAESPGHSVRGTVQIAGEAQSLAARAWQQIAAVLVRESGF